MAEYDLGERLAHVDPDYPEPTELKDEPAALTVNLAIRVTPSMLSDLRLQAQEEDRPVGWLVRKFIAAGLSTEKQEA